MPQRHGPREAREEELVELTVERLGAQGDGIAEWRDAPVFLPFTVPGDRLWARLGARRGGGREGRAVEWLAYGPGRAEPPCPHFGPCGGCALQHLDADLYESVKLSGLREALRRVGIDPAPIRPLRRLTKAVRRRVRLGLLRPRRPAAPVQIGFRERFSHALVDLRGCIVIEPALLALVEPLRGRIPALLPPGGRAEAMLTETDSGIDLVFETVERPGLAALEALGELAEAADLARITWRSLEGAIPVVERRPARVLLSGVAVPLPPGAFLQPTREGESLLIDEIVGAIAPHQPVLDLFAGLGTFALALAPGGRSVHAVEGDAAAAAALSRAAAGMRNLTVERRDLARNPLPREAASRWMAAVFDPPRAGARRQTEALALSTLVTIVAVSCNPATFARDAACLIAGGFNLERVVPIDQFVWTPHLEIVAMFRR